MIDPDKLEQPVPPLSHLLFDEVTALRQEVDRIRDQRDKALQERDQARRMYCTCMESPTRTSGTPAADTARLWEWDCFEEAIKP